MAGGGLELHVMSGLIDWPTLIAVSVSYRLVSMFMLAPEEEGRIGPWVLRLSISELALVWAKGLLGADPAAAPIAYGGAALLLAAAALYLLDMVRLLRTRRRPVLELNNKAAAAALAALACAFSASPCFR